MERVVWLIIAVLIGLWAIGVVAYPVHGAVSFLLIIAGFVFLADLMIWHRTPNR